MSQQDIIAAIVKEVLAELNGGNGRLRPRLRLTAVPSTTKPTIHWPKNGANWSKRPPAKPSTTSPWTPSCPAR
ncbi:MAG: hypothetical protein IPG51_01675 [Chloroflexi bacterium]|nr:hypothetical protein [Chloroflexota bacterium]